MNIRPVRPTEVTAGQILMGVRWRAPYSPEAGVVLVDMADVMARVAQERAERKASRKGRRS